MKFRSVLVSKNCMVQTLFAILLSLTFLPAPAAADAKPASKYPVGRVSDLFTFTSQGSYLFPYSWFRALELADDTALFAAPQNLAKYGWIFSKPGALNPDDLPIGFAIEKAEMPGAGKWLGVTCAACHTANVKYRNVLIRVDGAPTMADFGLFLNELSRTMLANHPVVNPVKFNRFATRVIGAGATGAQITNLKNLYLAYSVRFSGRAWMRTPPTHAGPGRVDALTQITNSLAVFDLGLPDNLHPPAAPTSYPFLWLTPRLDWVQWNPIAGNPIARNAGEVLGVFGEVNLGQDPATKYTSSIDFRNLHVLEEWVAILKPPKWPEQHLPAIAEAKWKAGKTLFDKNCRACHNMPPFDLTKKEDNIAGKQFIKIKRVPQEVIGTDPLYVQGILGRFVYTDQLAPDFGGAQIVPALQFFTSTVGRAVERGFKDMNLTPAEVLAYSGYRFYPKVNPADPNEKLRPYTPPSVSDLKGGPLLGIWATGPFLHNGSVPNLYQLLSAPEQRDKVFWVGDNELDVDNLGFMSIEKPGLFRFDTNVPGNRNSGHAYPAQPYTHDEKLSVIEYLKDPERF